MKCSKCGNKLVGEDRACSFIGKKKDILFISSAANMPKDVKERGKLYCEKCAREIKGKQGRR